MMFDFNQRVHLRRDPSQYGRIGTTSDTGAIMDSETRTVAVFWDHKGADVVTCEPVDDLVGEDELRECRRLFFAAMRHPEMRMFRLALLHLSRECEIDWRTIESIAISSGEFSGCWGFEFNQYYVYVSLDGLGIDMASLTYQDFSMIDLHWEDLPECLCYACEKNRIA